VFQSWMKLKPW